jgi:hypothetical protein
MALLRNNTERAFNIGGEMIIPGSVADINDLYCYSDRVQELIVSGELSLVLPPDKTEPAEDQTVPAGTETEDIDVSDVTDPQPEVEPEPVAPETKSVPKPATPKK